MATRRLFLLSTVGVIIGTMPLAAQKGSVKALTTGDLVEIQQLYARYNLAIDAGDSAGYAATFTPDGVFDTHVGHDAIAKFAASFHAGLGAHVRHWNTNLMILPSATGASGQVYLMLVDVATTPATIMASGSYSDELVKTAKGWRFIKRAIRIDAAPAKSN